MKKLICFLVIFLWVEYTPTVKAPNGVSVMHIISSPPIAKYNVHDPLLRAVIGFESNWKEDAVNSITGARGILQILPPMINEVNRILYHYYGSAFIKYTWDDAWNPLKSIEIWYIVQNHHNPLYDSIRACQLWFGMGMQWDGMTWVEYHEVVLLAMSTPLN